MLTEPAFDPLSQTKLHDKPGYLFTSPYLHPPIIGRIQPRWNMVNREYHPRIALTLRPESVNVVIQLRLTGSTLHLNKCDLISGKIL